MLATLGSGGVRPEHFVQRTHKGVRTRRSLDGAVDAYCDPPRTCQNTAHLSERLSSLWKKLQSELTQRDVEAARRKWQIERTALDPVRHRSFTWQRSGDAKHAGIQVEPRHVSRTHPLCCQTRDDASTAGYVNDGFTGLRLGSIDEVFSPLARDRRHEIALIKFGTAAIELPMPVTHGPFHRPLVERIQGFA
jgi:hypothetical protein